jgi:hypothetical protein
MTEEQEIQMHAEIRKKAISEMILPLVTAQIAGGEDGGNVYDNEGMQACIDYALRMAIRIQNAKEKL